MDKAIQIWIMATRLSNALYAEIHAKYEVPRAVMVSGDPQRMLQWRNEFAEANGWTREEVNAYVERRWQEVMQER